MSFWEIVFFNQAAGLGITAPHFLLLEGFTNICYSIKSRVGRLEFMWVDFSGALVPWVGRILHWKILTNARCCINFFLIIYGYMGHTFHPVWFIYLTHCIFFNPSTLKDTLHFELSLLFSTTIIYFTLWGSKIIIFTI